MDINPQMDYSARLVRWIWPEIETLNAVEREAGSLNVIYTVTYLPVFIASVAWLVFSTDLTTVRAQWPVLLLFFALMVLFEVFDFYWFVELTPGEFSSGGESLWILVGWSAVLIFGPAGLWLIVIKEALIRCRAYMRSRTKSARWDVIRNSVLIMSGVLLGGMVAISIYQELGQQFPVPDLRIEHLIPTTWATLIYLVLSILLLLPFILATYRLWRKAGGTSAAYFRLFSVGIEAQLLAIPFSILAAGLYSLLGLWVFVFYVSGWLITSLLAQQLSRAIDRSQQRSRELARLEQLSRAILTSAPDGSTLPELLSQHVQTIFSFCRVEIRFFPDQVIFNTPGETPVIQEEAWTWLPNLEKAASFRPKKPLPWGGRDNVWGIIAAPIRDLEDGHVFGGVFVKRYHEAKAIVELLPAVQTLVDLIASAQQQVKTYLRALEHQRAAQELALAGQIQASFLPAALPHISGWEIAARLEPARETSGDFYDVIPLASEKLGLVVADVTDKGMGAALYMAMCRTLLRIYIETYPDHPETVLAAVNRRIIADTESGMMVTAFLGVLDLDRNELTWCNAGHNPPYFFRMGEMPVELGRTGGPLGVFEEMTWDTKRIRFHSGETLFIYSDGIPDAENERNEFFGSDRLKEYITGLRSVSAGEIAAQVIEEVGRFGGKSAQLDDMTILVVTRNVNNPGS